MTREVIVRHPRAAGAVLSVIGVLLGAALVVACASLVSSCAIAPRIPPAVATVDVAVEKAIVAWLNDQAKAIEDDLAADGGTIEEWCEAMRTPHQTTQRVLCAARALGDLALSGQELLETAGADSAEWTDWLAAVPPLITATLDAFEAADYEPPASVDRALRMLGGLLDLVSDGPAADIPCEVTEAPAECLEDDAGSSP